MAKENHRPTALAATLVAPPDKPPLPRSIARDGRFYALVKLLKQLSPDDISKGRIIELAVIIHTYMLAADDYYLGRSVSGVRGQRGATKVRIRKSGASDVRRLRKAALARDQGSLSRIWSSLSAAIRDILRDHGYWLALGDIIDWVALVESIDRTLGDDRIQNKPTMVRHDKAALAIIQAYEEFTDRPATLVKATDGSGPRGGLFEFALTVSQLYRVPIVTERSHGRLAKVRREWVHFLMQKTT